MKSDDDVLAEIDPAVREYFQKLVNERRIAAAKTSEGTIFVISTPFGERGWWRDLWTNKRVKELDDEGTHSYTTLGFPSGDRREEDRDPLVED